jgi:predicted RNA-binding Zn-ribbon protein involved in translation (DUF1610 family)
MSNFVKYCIAGAFLLGIGFCVYFISARNLTATEAGLLSIVLTILSVLATWIVTHMYSQSQYKKAIKEVQESHRTNLRTYALKAAEKVNNLSTQLGQLAAYLGESLEEGDDERVREDLLSKQERIESAIRIINMLKSVNDTALSDWEGVIGDELDEQRELKAEREEEVGELIERLEAISESQMDTQQYAQDSTQALAKEIVSLRRDLRAIAVNLGLTPIRLAKFSERKPRREAVETHCPACGAGVTYKQRANPKSIKAFKCEACGAKLFSRYDAEKGFTVEIRHVAAEQVPCPSCKTMCDVELDIFPRSSLAVQCSNCQARMTITRTIDGIDVKTQQIGIESEVLTDDIVELVKNNLPSQPWPTGINKSVADKLGLRRQVVAYAIQKLIRKGVFKPQIDGKLYVPMSSATKQKSQSKQSGEG